MSEVQYTVRDAINRLKEVNATGKTNLLDKGVDLPADEPTTTDVVDGIEDIETGSSLNIAYGNTAPEDTSKLWVKTAQPQNVTVDYDINNGVESVQALSTTLTEGRADIGCGKVGDKIYLFCTDNNLTIRIFDTTTNTLTSTGVTTTLWHSAFCAVGNKIYIFGGQNTFDSTKTTIHVYDTVNNSISTSPSVLPQPLMLSACAAVGTKIYIFGGFINKNLTASNAIYVYDTENDALNTLSATLQPARGYVGICVFGTKIYLFGGYNGSAPTNIIDVFDTTDNTISTLSPTLPIGCYAMSAATIGTKCYLMGGRVTSAGDPPGVDTINVFDAETETITTSSVTLPQPLFAAGCSSVGNDAYVFGGASSQLGFIQLNTIYKFTATFPLDEGDVYLQSDVFKNKFTLVTAPTEVKTGVSAVYVGNASNEAEYAEALLYDGSDWSPIV